VLTTEKDLSSTMFLKKKNVERNAIFDAVADVLLEKLRSGVAKLSKSVVAAFINNKPSTIN
jgi:hypothetical protein